MNPTAPSPVSQPLLVALGLACLFAIAAGASESFRRTVASIAEIIWLYVSNARG